MGSFGKKLLGFSVIGAAAGAAFYYLKKQKEEDPDLEEDFADFQDNVKKRLHLPKMWRASSKKKWKKRLRKR